MFEIDIKQPKQIHLQLKEIKTFKAKEHKDGNLQVECLGVECWVCGCAGKMTMHHTIPQHLKPKRNVIVPVCQPCHENINTFDYTGIKSYGRKIVLEMKRLRSHCDRWKHYFGKMIENDKQRDQ